MANQLTLPPDAKARQDMLGKLHDRASDKMQLNANSRTKSAARPPRADEKPKS